MPDNQESPSKELDDHKGGDLLPCSCNKKLPRQECDLGNLGYTSTLYYYKCPNCRRKSAKYTGGSDYNSNVGYICAADNWNSQIIDATKNSDHIQELQEQLTTTQQALDSAVEALKFYANEENYRSTDVKYTDGFITRTIAEVYKEKHKIAKAALAAINGNNEIDICEQLAKEDL